MAYGFIERFKAPYTTITFGGTQAITKSGTIPAYQNVYAAGTTLGEYAVFGGGALATNSSSVKDVTVFAVNSDNLLIFIEYFSVGRDYLAAAHFDNYAVFAGGRNSSGASVNNVDAYSINFFRSTNVTLNDAAHALAGVSFGNYAIFAGGQGTDSKLTSVTAFRDYLDKTNLSDLNSAVSVPAGARNSNYAIIAGGYTDSGTSSSVTAYDSNLAKTTPSDLSIARFSIAAGTAGDYALFVGGETSDGVTNVAEAYDKNLTKLSAQNYEWGLRKAAATSLGSYLVIFGGMGGANNYRRVDYYDSNLVRHNAPNLTRLAINGTAASSSEYAYFFGGNYGSSYSEVIEVYNLPNKVTVYPGTKYKLGSMQNEVTASSMQTINTEAPISGYIKIKNANLP